MKRYISLIIMLLLAITVKAQDYVVESVEHLPTDMTARTHIKKDGKDRQCAVLRFATQGIAAEKRAGFYFTSDFGSEVVEKSIHDGEIWVWVSPNIKVLRIKHEELGAYELHFTQYLTESVQELHTYKVLLKAVTPMVASSGSGTLRITTQPDGATISINGKEMSQKTPYYNEMLLAGKYEITISKERYKTVVKTLEIADNANENINEILKSDVANITVVSDSGAEIFIDGKSVGTGSWTGELLSGNHTIKCSSKYHADVERTIEVIAENNVKHEFHPTPILGIVEISSEPTGATVFIDGKNCGVTPITLDNVIIGPHELKIEKENCATVTRNFTLDEKNILTFTEKLQTDREVFISTNRSGDKLYADGNYLGVSPLTATLTFGSHNVKAIRETKTVEKTITVSQGSGPIEVKLSFFDGKNKTFTVNGVSFEMIAVNGGTFTMGATFEQGGDAYDSEKPAHSVTLSDYYIGKFEVTQELWQAVMGSNPSKFKGNKNPVENVSWNDCLDFIRKLNQLTGQNFRLPTEAEWEYAARGGKKSKGYKYSGSNNINKVMWYYDNSSSKTHAVGTKSPNELGIYDMSGNVWEWCSDWYGDYGSGSQTNPQGASSGSYRVRRGGSWGRNARYCRVSDRISFTPGDRNDGIGFRLVVSQ